MKSYINEPYCPFCKSCNFVNIPEHNEFSILHYYRNQYCRDCGKYWDEIYTLTHIDLYPEGISKDSTDRLDVAELRSD